jgi:hypothetical protein
MVENNLEFINKKAIKEREVKAEFVKELGQLLNKYGVEDIKELKYEDRSTETNIEEWVTVIFNDDYSYKQSVAMDSLAAVVRDVMRSLEY